MRYRVVLIDGLEVNKATPIDPEDPGLTMGMSVFETAKSYGGNIFRFSSHLQRLESSAQSVGIHADIEVVRTEVLAALENWASSSREAKVRITLTGGGRRIVVVSHAPRIPRQVSCRTDIHPGPLNHRHIKHGCRGHWEWERASQSTDELLWIDHKGLVLEGTTSNVFRVSGGVIQTPPDDGRILPGITRDTVLNDCVKLGLKVEQVNFSPKDDVEEIWITSTLKGLVAVTSLDGVATPGLGVLGRRLKKAYQDHTTQSQEAYPLEKGSP